MAHATARYSSGVFGALNRLAAVALVIGVVLVAPSVALACNDGPASAVNVYSECVPAGGGDKPTSGNTTPTTSTNVSPRTVKALKKAGKDRSRLLALVKGYGAKRFTTPKNQAPAAAATTASALGSAFDLGSGPTALLVALGGTAVVLLGATGFRGYRRWHRP
jgi:hypothetical protein